MSFCSSPCCHGPMDLRCWCASAGFPTRRLSLWLGHEWHQQIGRAFELGAFDYIAKPFTTTELVARVDAGTSEGRVRRLERVVCELSA